MERKGSQIPRNRITYKGNGNNIYLSFVQHTHKTLCYCSYVQSLLFCLLILRKVFSPSFLFPRFFEQKSYRVLSRQSVSRKLVDVRAKTGVAAYIIFLPAKQIFDLSGPKVLKPWIADHIVSEQTSPYSIYQISQSPNVVVRFLSATKDRCVAD